MSLGRWKVMLDSECDLGDDGTLAGLAGVLLGAGAKRPKHLVVARHDGDSRAVVLSGTSPTLGEDLASAIEYRGGEDPDDLPPWQPGFVSDRERSSLGFANVRGLGRDVSLLVSFDAKVFRTIAGEPRMRNGLTLWVPDGRVAGVPSLEWACRVFDGLVETCRGLVCMTLGADEEHVTKCRAAGGGFVKPNMLQGLTGPFWRTAFGARYVDLIGADVFASLPEGCCRMVSGRPVVEIYSNPDAWVGESGPGSLRELVIDRLGEDIFFDPRHPDRPARTPWHF